LDGGSKHPGLIWTAGYSEGWQGGTLGRWSEWVQVALSGVKHARRVGDRSDGAAV
jgi:hypothetical protein